MDLVATELIDLLDRTFTMTARITDALGPADLDRPTPCPDWTVGRLLSHVIGVLDAFAARQPNPFAATELGTDVAGQFRASAAACLAAWSVDGALDGEVARPGRPALPWSRFAGINVVDTFTHGWDLAQATGQTAKIDEELAEQCLMLARQVVPDNARAIVGFEPALPEDPTQSASNRVAAFLGRTPPA